MILQLTIINIWLETDVTKLRVAQSILSSPYQL